MLELIHDISHGLQIWPFLRLQLFVQCDLEVIDRLIFAGPMGHCKQLFRIQAHKLSIKKYIVNSYQFQLR